MVRLAQSIHNRALLTRTKTKYKFSSLFYARRQQKNKNQFGDFLSVSLSQRTAPKKKNDNRNVRLVHFGETSNRLIHNLQYRISSCWVDAEFVYIVLHTQSYDERVPSIVRTCTRARNPTGNTQCSKRRQQQNGMTTTTVVAAVAAAHVPRVFANDFDRPVGCKLSTRYQGLRCVWSKRNCQMDFMWGCVSGGCSRTKRSSARCMHAHMWMPSAAISLEIYHNSICMHTRADEKKCKGIHHGNEITRKKGKNK